MNIARVHHSLVPVVAAGKREKRDAEKSSRKFYSTTRFQSKSDFEDFIEAEFEDVMSELDEKAPFQGYAKTAQASLFLKSLYINYYA